MNKMCVPAFLVACAALAGTPDCRPSLRAVSALLSANMKGENGHVDARNRL